MKNKKDVVQKPLLSYIAQVIMGLTIISSVSVVFMGVVFNYVNSKVLTIEIGCLAVLVLGVVLISWKSIKEIIMRSRVVQVFLGFVIVSAIATVLGKDQALSFYGHFERGTGLFFTLLTVFGGLAAVIISKLYGSTRSAILYPLSLSGFILGIFAWCGATGLNLSIWNALNINSGGGATLGNSSYAGTVLLLTFFITLYLFLTTNEIWKKITLGMIGFFTIVNPVMISMPFFKPLAGTTLGFIGDARGATMSVLIGIGMIVSVLFIYSSKKSLRVLGRIGVGGIISGIVIVTGLLFVPTSFVHNYFVKTTGAARFIYWNMAIHQIEAHPLLGTGPETFRYAHQQFFDPQLVTIGELWADKPHSVYLETALGTGLLGLLCYLILIGFVIKGLVKMRDPEHRFLVATMIGLITAYILNNVIMFDSMTSWFMFVMIIFWITSETEWSSYDIFIFNNDKKTAAEKYISAALVLLILVPVSWIIYGEILKLNYDWQALFAQPPQRTALYAKEEAASPYGAGISIAQQFDTYSQQYGTDVKTPIDVARTDIRALIDTLLTAMQKYPPNMQSYSALGRLAVDDMRYTSVNKQDLAMLRLCANQINQLSQFKNPLGNYMLGRADFIEKKYGTK